jgi:hypothetical protein
MRLRTGPRHVRGWADGVIERAEPDRTDVPLGLLDSCTNFVSTPTGRLAIRGGSRVAQTLHAAAGTDMAVVCGVWPYSQTGAIAIASKSGPVETNLYRLTGDLSFYTGAEATSRHNLSTAIGSSYVMRPVVVELYEKLYIADASLSYASRNSLCSVTSAGTVLAPIFRFASGISTTLKPYCLAAYNGVLFIAGYDDNAEEEAMVRHSYLGRDPAFSTFNAVPDAVDGFDRDAWAIIGAKGSRVTAMVPGNNILLVAKTNELYRISGTGRAAAGWQYSIAKLENTEGFGATNPYALCFAEGKWYGVGEVGPFRTDGSQVEALGDTRRESWPKASNLRNAWVAYHPTRRLVKFGFHMTPVDSGRSSTYPYVVWNYDLERNSWTGDEKYTADLMYAQAIPALSSTSATTYGYGPTAAPTNLAVTSSTAPSVGLSWTNGDASAGTQVWSRNVTTGGGYFIVDAAAAGATTLTTSGPSGWFLAGQQHKIKIRHQKNGIYSDFSSEVTATFT